VSGVIEQSKGADDGDCGPAASAGGASTSIGRLGGSALGPTYNGFSTPARAPIPRHEPRRRRRDRLPFLMAGGVVAAAAIGVGLGLRVDSRPAATAVVPAAYATATVARITPVVSEPRAVLAPEAPDPAVAEPPQMAPEPAEAAPPSAQEPSPNVKHISSGSAGHRRGDSRIRPISVNGRPADPASGMVRVHRLAPRRGAAPKRLRAEAPAPVRHVAMITSSEGMREIRPDGPPRPPRADADCSYARTRAERMVCGDPELAAMDRDLARAYERAVVNGAPRRVLRREQRDWLGARERAARQSGDAVYDIYVQRIGELENMTDGGLSDGR